MFFFVFSAEFIIDLAYKNDTLEMFKKALVKNGAEFSVSLSLSFLLNIIHILLFQSINNCFDKLKDSFIANLLRIIQHMQPKTSKQSGKKCNKNIDKNDKLACKFPGLAIPNETISEVNDPISDVMAELEAFAPILKSKYDLFFT